MWIGSLRAAAPGLGPSAPRFNPYFESKRATPTAPGRSLERTEVLGKQSNVQEATVPALQDTLGGSRFRRPD